jgi:hypothetical protein
MLGEQKHNITTNRAGLEEELQARTSFEVVGGADDDDLRALVVEEGRRVERSEPFVLEPSHEVIRQLLLLLGPSRRHEESRHRHNSGESRCETLTTSCAGEVEDGRRSVREAYGTAGGGVLDGDDVAALLADVEGLLHLADLFGELQHVGQVRVVAGRSQEPHTPSRDQHQSTVSSCTG